MAEDGPSGSSQEEKGSSIWTLLPSFDPSVDDPREYKDKVLFLHKICPARDKGMLAPRLAMSCKGTAWSQVRQLDASKLTDPENGVTVLLKALSSWDEAAELQTYEKFEKALFRTQPKSDETTMSFVNRLTVAFSDMGPDLTMKDVQAFILLRQSSLSSEDKRKVITITGGSLEASKIEQAMRTLPTKILTTGTEAKKKIYPANYVDTDDFDEAHFVDDILDDETMVMQMAEDGDEDAIFVTEYEGQILDYVQEMPELAECFNAYSSARARLRERAKSRGFWPPKGRSKGKNSGGRGKGGGKGNGQKRSLAERIATSSCRACGKVGHWKWECPTRTTSTSSASTQEVGNFTIKTGDPEPEFVENLPNETLTIEDMMANLQPGRDPRAPSLIQVQQTLMNDQLEELVGHDYFPQYFSCDVLPKTQNPIVQLCRRWGKLRDAASESAEALVVGRTEVAVVDTGASKTVVGKDNLKRFTDQLSPELMAGIRSSKSQTVFRFGNNGTLPSLFPVYIPLRSGGWFRIEVVEGKTPFLLSNSFLRKIKGQIDFEQDVLRIPRWQQEIKLTVDGKGLYLVDMVELLEVISPKGRDKRDDREKHHTWTLAASALNSDNPAFQEDPCPVSTDSDGGSSRSPPSPCREPRPQCDLQPRRNSASRGSSHTSRMEHVRGRQREAQGQNLQGHLRGRSRVRSVYQKQKDDKSNTSQLSFLLPCHGESKDPGKDNEPTANSSRVLSDIPGNYAGTDGPAGNDVGKDDCSHTSGPAANSSGTSDDASQRKQLVDIQETIVVGSVGGQSSSHKDRPDPNTGAGNSHSNGSPSEGAGSSSGIELDSLTRCRSEVHIASADQECALNPEQVCAIISQLEEFCCHLETCFQAMQAHPETRSSCDRSHAGEVPRTFLEVNIGECSPVGVFVDSARVGYVKQTISRSSLRDNTYEDAVWQVLDKKLPQHVWVNVGLKNPNDEELYKVGQFCHAMYFDQVSRGDHFHIWAPEMHSWSQYLPEILMGTLQTRYEPKVCGLGRKYRGNNFLSRRVVFQTTSKNMHSFLDHRYISQRDPGKVYWNPKGLPENLRYTRGLARNVADVVQQKHSEAPLIHEEICATAMDKRGPEVTRSEGEQALKRRRYLFKRGPRETEGYNKTLDTWASVFRKLNARVPRVGNFIVGPEDELIRSVQSLVPGMRVHHVEACRGTNRLRTPQLRDNPQDVTHRHTVVIHRQTGEIEEVGNIENWTRLPKYKQHGPSKPAKVSLTVFGKSPEPETPQETSHPDSNVVPHPVLPLPSNAEQTSHINPSADVDMAPPEDPDKEAWGPPPIANHGPAFRALNPQEKGEIRRLHHNLGHPDGHRFARYLKQGGACEAVVKGALQYQCDACSESRRGFMASRPAAIHDNISFNTKVGIDLASWKNSKGKEFSFVHFIDEGTMFHLGAECLQGVDGVVDHFEHLWVNWAGYPQEVYVDPGGEFVSDAWAVRMQEAGIKVHMSASDSHWQLGRAEIHGSTIKQMLNKMDLESSVAFQRALRQAFNAKNTLSRIDGYTPQQAVIGISSRRWHGPATIIAIEKSKVVWLAHSGRLVRASPEQLRPASLREWQRVPKDERGKPLANLMSLKEQLRQAPNFLDLDGEERPEREEVEAELDRQVAEPEVEAAPESLPVDGLPSPEGVQVEPEAETGPSLSPETLPVFSEDARQEFERNVQIPAPEEDSDCLLVEFGDDVAFEPTESILHSGVETCWEIDISPPETWNLPKELDEDMICLASDARKKRVEVRLRDLTVREQQRFAAAKHKEVGAWLSHKTVRKVAKGRIPDKNIMRCRWIYTWKAADPSSAATADGRKAKARLVVLGFEDPDLDRVPNDAPTLSKDGRQLLLQKICSNRWRLCSFDISTAFLHGKGDGRLLGIHAPPEVREALSMEEGDQCELQGGAYGRIDAPYLWYQELRSTLLELGFTQCPLDPCIYSLSTEDSTGNHRCHGILGIHVDDGICGGDSHFKEVLEKLRSRYNFGSFEEGSFVFTGIRVHQWDDMSIELDQVEYIEGIEPINVPRDRRRNPDDPIDEPERKRFRQLIGSLQYAAVHTRPDISAKVGEMQSAVNSAKVAHLLEANRILQEAKRHKVTLMIVPIQESKVTFCAFSDASFASSSNLSAHQGTVIFATSSELLENNSAVVCPMAWSSKKIPRVVRSTLGAEAIALSNSVDRLSWLRVFWAWMKKSRAEWQVPEKLLPSEPTAAAVTDCKSVFDIVTRTAPPQCEEHRTTIECLLIRERMLENCRLRWVASGAMLADCLTKSMEAGRLRECLRTGRYSLFDEDLVLRQRSEKRKQLNWVKKPESQDTSECLHSRHDTADFWKLDSERRWIDRVHCNPRWNRFTPIGVGECPVGFEEFGVHRTTFANFISGKKHVFHDTWVGATAHDCEAESWTGVTRIFLQSSQDSAAHSSTFKRKT